MRVNKVTAQAVHGKRVLVRVDYNVPLDTSHTPPLLKDDTRIQASLPTLRFLIENQARVILTSHLGRPAGKEEQSLRMDPVAKHLSKLLGQEVKKIDTCVGSEAQKAVDALQPGEVLMLENNRFLPGEEENDPKLSQALAQLADVFVNDALSVSHRAHASVVGVTQFLPSYAGLALSEEVSLLSSLIENPQRPFVALVGGAKISDKVEAIRNLSKVADVVLVGGGVANNFFKADGLEVFHSYLEEEKPGKPHKKISYVKVAEELIENTKSEKMLLHGYIPLSKIIYPPDVIAAETPQNPKDIKVIDLTDGTDDDKEDHKSWMYLDIGPKTQRLYQDIILEARTVFWNGPMGVFEQPEFMAGTKAVATAMAKSSAQTVIGGGDTISAVQQLQLADRYNSLSTAGSAALEFLGGKKLPGLIPLEETEPSHA